MVARGRNGDYYTPWSAPVTFKLLAPFDMSSVSAIDSRGPSYRLRGTLDEPYAAGGRVTVAIAKGKNGKKFRTLGKAKVNSKGVWTLRFTVRKRGCLPGALLLRGQRPGGQGRHVRVGADQHPPGVILQP